MLSIGHSPVFAGHDLGHWLIWYEAQALEKSLIQGPAGVRKNSGESADHSNRPATSGLKLRCSTLLVSYRSRDTGSVAEAGSL